MASVFVYVVDRDFGFAPNPFGGVCSLATCKPSIRSHAQLGDWVFGMGGARLKATGRLIFAMQVTASLRFNEYWQDDKYALKKPIRNGSSLRMVGDNIYCYDETRRVWAQADSHHSYPDGSPNIHNVAKDTSVDRVLLSEHYYYFGRLAPLIPPELLSELAYRNGIGHRRYDIARCSDLLMWLETEHAQALNEVSADPFDFEISHKRYSGADNKVS